MWRIIFQRPTEFLVLWSALQLWKRKIHFETEFVWAPMIQIYRKKEEVFLYDECYVLIVIKIVWSNNEEHTIHDIEKTSSLVTTCTYYQHFVNTSGCSWQTLHPKTNPIWHSLYSRKQHLWFFCMLCDVFANTMFN